MRPLVQATIVYSVSLVFPPIVMGAFSATLGLEYLKSHAYVLGPLLEFFLVGFLCILFAISSHDSRDVYGLTTSGIARSIGVGFALVALQSAAYWLSGLPVVNPRLDAFTQSLAQPFPFSVGFALSTAFAYGPLQVFFLVFLVDRLDRHFGVEGLKTRYKAIVITVVIWVLPHILNVSILGLGSTLIQMVKMLAEGLLVLLTFRYTKNSVGPMIYWTFIELAQTY